MDADKEKRFRFRARFEAEQSAGQPKQQQQPEAWTGNADVDDTLRGLAAGVGGDKMYGLYKGLTDGDLSDVYDGQAAKSVRQNNALSEERSPVLYNSGKFAPSLAAGLATGGGSTALEAALIAGGTGAASGALESDAENLGDLAKDTVLSGVIGAGAGALGHGIGKGLGYVVDKVKGGFDSGANRLMAKHVLSPGDYGKAVSKGEVQKLGQAVFDENLAGPLSGREEIANRAGALFKNGQNAERSILAQTPDADINVLRQRVQQNIVDPARAGGRGHSVEPVEKLLRSIDDIGASPGTNRRMIDGQAVNDLKGNWQEAFRNSADTPSAKGLKAAAREARLFEEEHVGKYVPGRLPEFMEAKGDVMIGGKVRKGMEYAAQNPSNDLAQGAMATLGIGVVGGPGAAAATGGGAIVKHLADGREKTLLAHAMKALGQKDPSMFRSAVSKALTRNPFFLGKAGARLQQAMAEDSATPGSNKTAKVAWEEQSNPELQQYLKEERER